METRIHEWKSVDFHARITQKPSRAGFNKVYQIFSVVKGSFWAQTCHCSICSFSGNGGQRFTTAETLSGLWPRSTTYYDGTTYYVLRRQRMITICISLLQNLHIFKNSTRNVFKKTLPGFPGCQVNSVLSVIKKGVSDVDLLWLFLDQL